VARDEFAEFADVHGDMYGTLRREVQRVLEGGRHVVMDIDVQGAEQFAAVFPEAVQIFVLPPSGRRWLNDCLGAEVLRARVVGPSSQLGVARVENGRTV